MRIIAFAMLLLAAGPASAFESTGNAVADAFLRSAEQAGFADARAGSVSRDGGTTVVADVAAGRPGEGRTLTVAVVRMDGALVNADNQIVADTIIYEDVKITDEAGRPASSIGSLTLSDARLGGDGEDGVTGLVGDFRTIVVNDVTARSDAGQEVRLARFDAELADQNGVSGADITVEDLVFDLSLFEEPTANSLRDLGYDGLAVDLTAAGEWEAASGRAVLSGSSLSVDGMGTLSLEAGASGLTSQTYDTLRTGNLDFASLLNALGSVSLSGVTLRFTDAGLTDRLLDRFGEQAGLSREAISTRILAALSQPLGLVGDPAFSEKVVGAARSFLADPSTLTVRAMPNEAISALQVVGAAMLNPRLLPSLLALEVTYQ